MIDSERQTTVDANINYKTGDRRRIIPPKGQVKAEAGLAEIRRVTGCPDDIPLVDWCRAMARRLNQLGVEWFPQHD